MPKFNGKINWETGNFLSENEREAYLKDNNYQDGTVLMINSMVDYMNIIIGNAKYLARKSGNTAENYYNYVSEEEKDFLSKGAHYLQHTLTNISDGNEDIKEFNKEFEPFYESLQKYVENTKNKFYKADDPIEDEIEYDENEIIDDDNELNIENEDIEKVNEININNNGNIGPGTKREDFDGDKEDKKEKEKPVPPIININRLDNSNLIYSDDYGQDDDSFDENIIKIDNTEKKDINKEIERFSKLKDDIAGQFINNRIEEDDDELFDLNDRKIDRTVNVAEYIEEIRDKAFKETRYSKLTMFKKQDYLANFTAIMAARALAKSERNKGQTLNKQVKQSEIRDMVYELNNNPAFQDFKAELLADKDKFLTALFGAMRNPGHGGKLDDMFTEYLLKLPPGKMPNDKILERWMPTVKDRIESIQKQAKECVDAAKEKEDVDLYFFGSEHPSANLANKKKKLDDIIKRNDIQKAAAEILVLRNLVGAHRNKKESLNVKVPVHDEDQYSIEETINNDLYGKGAITNAESDPDIRKLIFKGHGGELVEKLREQQKRLDNFDPEADTNDYLHSHLYENTIKGTLENMAEEAEDELIVLGTENAPVSDEMLNIIDGKVFLKKYFYLTALAYDTDNHKMDAKVLGSDTPWLELKKIDEKKLNYSQDFNDYQKQDVIDAIKVIKEKGDNPLEVIKAIRPINTRVKNNQGVANAGPKVLNAPAGNQAQGNQAQSNQANVPGLPPGSVQFRQSIRRGGGMSGPGHN